MIAMNLDENLLDFLGKRHMLPTFNLPTDAVPFIVRSRSRRGSGEKIHVRMSTGLEQALTQYGPGKKLMVKKEEYVSHGLYIDFPPRPSPDELDDCADDAERDQKRLDAAVHRFRRWFNEALENQEEEFGRLTWLHMCNNAECRHTLDYTGPRHLYPDGETVDINGMCVLCKIGEYNTKPLVQPPGFAPLMNAENGKHITPESDSYTHVLSTRWPTTLSNLNQDQEWSMIEDERFKMTFVKQAKLVNINGGRNEEDPMLSGFSFCRDCGYLGTSTEGTPATHDRPYAISYDDMRGIRTNPMKTAFKQKVRSKCSAEDGGGDRTIIQDGDLTHRRIFGKTFQKRRSDVQSNMACG